ncbi:hypothetical protein Glove_97g65 [Diversispora epigaea]|uniref:Uncharacterized protein n=1 Tax=Diversispora epigaea TaxID=1348612 RepID=A0A397J4S0_9GLOM|nr:hypothetical protein Glove_97g65 [Diversispora epigaea]
MSYMSYEKIEHQIAELQFTEQYLDPYYEDSIDKYFERPTDIVFNSLIYPIYHRKFKNILTIPRIQNYWHDQKIELLLNEKKNFIPAESELEFKGNFFMSRARLQQFEGISVLLIGDPYQLPPVNIDKISSVEKFFPLFLTTCHCNKLIQHFIKRNLE